MKNYEIGTAVKYWPVAGCDDFKITRTRSKPWTIPSGSTLIKIEGVSGGVCVEHIKALDSTEMKILTKGE